jgi:hypothetical protein
MQRRLRDSVEALTAETIKSRESAKRMTILVYAHVIPPLVGRHRQLCEIVMRMEIFRTSRRRRLLGLVFVLLIGISSGIAYIMISFTIDGLPPDLPFPGWVAVLQPISQPSGDTVNLQMQSTVVGANPKVQYMVTVCGSRPYSGDLFMGALLSSAVLNGPFRWPNRRPRSVECLT